MRKTYVPRSVDAYVASLRGGGLPVYKGSIHQRGNGIGGLFSSLIRSVAPLLTRKVLPAIARQFAPRIMKKAARTAARGALRAAVGVAADRMKGVPIKKAAKRRIQEVGRDVLHTMMAPPGKRAYISGPTKRAVSRRSRKKKRVTVSKAKDVFS